MTLKDNNTQNWMEIWKKENQHLMKTYKIKFKCAKLNET